MKTNWHDLSRPLHAGIGSYLGHELLGHEDQKMWTRYAHLADSTLKDAAQAPADVFKAIIAGGKDAQKPPAKVVNLHRK